MSGCEEWKDRKHRVGKSVNDTRAHSFNWVSRCIDE